ncbi:Mannose-1-phosphate guanyltransferase [Lecanosticta acicola]|uniref:Mannose-1-phosphate guanyltransferase n=1 Tax=Lecanosticta acicola TaxID=111012 RepID=A0AAI8Z6U8_9PEZI|nr:Mannose-1-phosphate guanyltransferase [Lecanosticta acicola]
MASKHGADELLVVQELLGLKEGSKKTAGLADAIFVCVDCEAFEFAPDKITEVGVSVVDTRALQALSPGENGAAWLSKIESAHYLIEEYAHLKNKRFVKGCPESFSFGRTQTVRKGQASEVLLRVFADPTMLSQAHKSGEKKATLGRPIILVGHDLSNDDQFLKHLDFSLAGVTAISRRVDTQRVAGTKKRLIALKKLLAALDIEPRFLHNAGNDAAYTLQALLKMAVCEQRQPGSLVAKVEEQYAKPSASNKGQDEVRQGLSRSQRKALKRGQRVQQAAGEGSVADGGKSTLQASDDHTQAGATDYDSGRNKRFVKWATELGTQ